MILAIVCGVLSGVVGFIPLFIGLRLSRKATAASNFGHMSILILSLIISFIVMFGLAMLCIAIARDYAIPFVLSEAIALSVAAIAFGLKKSVSNSKER